MTQTAETKPSYLALLNGVAVAESRAYVYLNAWAQVTPNPEVKAILCKVALREGEHGMSFARRVNELGYEVAETDDTNFKKMLAAVRSPELNDRQKFEAIGLLKYCTEDGPDIFDNMFRDHSIDIHTGALLGRYVAEERDTLRLLKGCYDQLCAAERHATAPMSTNGSAPSATVDLRLAELEAKVDAIGCAIDSIRRVLVPDTIQA